MPQLLILLSGLFFLFSPQIVFASNGSGTGTLTINEVDFQKAEDFEGHEPSSSCLITNTGKTNIATIKFSGFGTENISEDGSQSNRKYADLILRIKNFQNLKEGDVLELGSLVSEQEADLFFEENTLYSSYTSKKNNKKAPAPILRPNLNPETYSKISGTLTISKLNDDACADIEFEATVNNLEATNKIFRYNKKKNCYSLKENSELTNLSLKLSGSISPKVYTVDSSNEDSPQWCK
jgi:hypothetical protein